MDRRDYRSLHRGETLLKDFVQYLVSCLGSNYNRFLMAYRCFLVLNMRIGHVKVFCLVVRVVVIILSSTFQVLC